MAEPPPPRTAFPFRPGQLERVVIFSPGGSQGGAFAAQALANAAAGGYEVVLHTRDPRRFVQNSLVRCGDRSVDIARHAHARISSGPLKIDPARTLIIDPTAAGGLSSTIAQTPEYASVAYSQNGIPGHMRQKREQRLDVHTLVSMTTSIRGPGGGIRVEPGGTIAIDSNDRLIDAWHRIMRPQGFFVPENVSDIHATQYEKIAFNNSVNILCTLFGKTLGELLAMCRADPRCENLVAGLAAEAHAVAAAQGIRLRPVDGLVVDIHAAMARFAGHATSMRAAFDTGRPTEVEMLNAGMAALGRRWGVATPLNERVATRLRLFEIRRDLDGLADGRFHQRHPALVGRAIEELLGASPRRRAGCRAA